MSSNKSSAAPSPTACIGEGSDSWSLQQPLGSSDLLMDGVSYAPPQAGPQWHQPCTAAPFAHCFNDFLFCFTTCNLPHVLVNGIYLVCDCSLPLMLFMSIDSLHWFPKEGLFLEPAQNSGGLQCLPLCTPIYGSPGLYSLLPCLLSCAHLILKKEWNGRSCYY